MGDGLHFLLVQQKNGGTQLPPVGRTRLIRKGGEDHGLCSFLMVIGEI